MQKTEKKVSEMKTKPCVCGNKMRQVINAEKGTRVGWWCPKCGEYDKAIGSDMREEKGL